MKKALKKLDNKGFTLVELIIVIAIIAVLAAVLAPQYIKYVERSRVGVDQNTINEVIHNTEICVADPKVYPDIASSTTVTVKNGAAVTSNDADLETALQGVFSGNIAFQSKTYTGKKYTITMTVGSDGSITVEKYAEDNWTAAT